MSFRSRAAVDNLGLWGNRDLRIAIFARAVAMLGDQLALIALVLRTVDGHGSTAWPVAVLLLAGGLPLVLLAPLVGRLVDRIDSRRLLVTASCAQVCCCLLLADVRAQPAVLTLVAALGAGQAVSSATWQALVPTIVGIDRLPAALGLSQATSTLAAIAAPVLGGVLTDRYGARLPLLLDAAGFAAIAVAAMRVRTRRGSRAGLAGDHRGGWAIVRNDELLLPLVLMLTVFILLGGMVNVVEVFLVRRTLGASATWYGVLGGVWGLGVFAGAMLGGRLRRSGGAQPLLVRLTVASSIGLAISLFGMGVAPTVVWLVPPLVIGGVSNGVLNLAIGSLVGIRSAEAARGRVSAMVGGLASAGQVGSLLLGGLLAGVLEPRRIFVLAGLLGALVAVVLGRRLTASADRSVSPAAPPDAVVEVPAELVECDGPRTREERARGPVTENYGCKKVIEKLPPLTAEVRSSQ
jgi:MFS family permease